MTRIHPRKCSMTRWPAVLAAAVLAAGGAAGAEPRAGADSLLGINLNGPADWNSEIPFVDAFRFSRGASQEEGKPWGQGPALDLDARGWVKRLAPRCRAEAILLTMPGAHRPQGEYVLTWKGKGTLRVSMGCQSIVSQALNRVVFVADPAAPSIFLSLDATDPADYVRDIRLFLPGTETTADTQPFRAGFLERWRGFNTLRFMDWQCTNGSKQRRWADRPTPEDATWMGKGIPVEIMVDLCNRLGANPWFCMPHMADDDYVRQFARLVKDRLDPGLKVYVEYSNEVWNGMFEQARWVQDQALERGIGPRERPWEGKAIRYAQRTAEIGALWAEQFPPERLVRVLAWQAAGGEYWLDGMLFGQGGAAGRVDALAIAPYITFCIPEKADQPGAVTAAAVAAKPLDELMSHLETKVLAESLDWAKTAAAVARKHGVRLLAYEGGQHLVGVMGGENNDAMTRLFQAANRDPRMGALYTRYLDGWKAAGGDVFCLFSSTGGWSKWGSWGLTEWLDEGPAEQPKLKAVLDWNAANRRAR